MVAALSSLELVTALCSLHSSILPCFKSDTCISQCMLSHPRFFSGVIWNDLCVATFFRIEKLGATTLAMGDRRLPHGDSSLDSSDWARGAGCTLLLAA